MSWCLSLRMLLHKTSQTGLRMIFAWNWKNIGIKSMHADLDDVGFIHDNFDNFESDADVSSTSKNIGVKSMHAEIICTSERTVGHFREV